jgi:prevent-host-death family protein
METMGLREARSRFSELVKRASCGQTIGITRRGKLAAMIVPAAPQETLEEIFRDIEQIRKRARLPKGVSVKDLIEEGRA